MKRPSGTRIFFSIITAICVFLFLTFFFSMSAIFSGGLKGFIGALPDLIGLKCLLSILIGVLILVIPDNKLSNIENVSVGNKQHGGARFMTDKEKKENYTFVKAGKEKEPGFIVGREDNVWIVETTDKTICLTSPPGGGKTKAVFIPTLYYNAEVNRNTGNGASILSLDAKSENLKTAGCKLEECGYKILFLDFRNPLQSPQFNLMNGVNEEINKYKSTDNQEEKLRHYARAERYAKQVSSSIVKNIMGEVKDSSSDFFNNTSQGLITGLILMVSQYGDEDERHIISVFRLIVELNGLIDNGNIETGQQRSKLMELLQYIDDVRITNYVAASVKADVRTSMNVFSSALSKLLDFIDAELEQMICGHFLEFNVNDFINKPTAIFLICPDEDTSRHFFASLFIRYFTTQLIDLAESSPNQRLPRKVLCLWDEFGNMPAIKDVDSLFTAARSRGIRFLYSIQSFSQLKKSYNKTFEEIILDSSQILMFTYVAPSAYETAKKLSDILGSQTVLSGTIARRAKVYNILDEDHTSTFQMIKRQLMLPEEIMAIPFGTFIVIKTGGKNEQISMKTQLPLYFKYLKTYPEYNQHIDFKFREIHVLDSEKIRMLGARQKNKLTLGMFD